MDVKKEGDMWVVRGISPKDTLFEIELLLNPAEFRNRRNSQRSA